MRTVQMKNQMKELQEIQALAQDYPEFVRLKVLDEVQVNDLRFPIHSISMGSEDSHLPVYGIFAGVHGLERIGVELCLYYLRSVCEQMKWDSELRERLTRCRVVCIPMVNPAGVFFGTRSNPRGVDLMRNAPIEAEGNVPWLAGGHRVSPRLPWYRGADPSVLEIETSTVIDFVTRELFSSPVSVAIDLHSGFGFRDRFWYPHANTHRPFAQRKQVMKMADVFTRSYPHHIYQIEPTSQSYLIHGDLWDHLTHIQQKTHPGRVFIPWTLEMGSWTWIRKNPLQFFRRIGIYHPMKPHRHRRVMRRHQALMDFLWRAAAENKVWVQG